jgi:uncharacterized protein YbjT (DUF2867 family)
MVGRYLHHVLDEDGLYDRRIVLSRGDYGNLRLPPVTHLYCCLGTTIAKAGSREAFRAVDFGLVLQFARAGRAAGARRMMVVSSVGADARSRNFYLRVKGEMEQALAAEGFEALHIFRPSVLMGKRDENRPGERWAIGFARSFEWAMVGGLSKYRPMPAGVLATAMAVAGDRGEPGHHVHHFREIMRLAGQ